MKDFERKVEEEGLMAAAEECNFVEEVNNFRKFSNSIPRDIGLDECVAGHDIAVILKKFGLALKDVDLFLKDLYQYDEDKNIT